MLRALRVRLGLIQLSLGLRARLVPKVRQVPKVLQVRKVLRVPKVQ